MSKLVAEHYAHPALVPPTRHGEASTARPPEVTAVDADDDVTVRWRSDRTATSYAVYRFDGRTATTCGFADASHLLATARRVSDDTQAYVDRTAQAGKTYTYYVTALDRQGQESRPGRGRTTE